MCGIVGYIGDKTAVPFLVDGLSKLEYRGYDSAGVAAIGSTCIEVEKSVGRLSNLEAKLSGKTIGGCIGIGHTRWATHGRPSDANSHPHTDCTGKFAVVHNGIIENYMKLKEELIAKGHVFKSETDTEVVAHLLEEHYDGNLEEAVKKILTIVEGSYALVFMTEHEPDKLVCSKQDNPLIIGLGEGENFIASDIPAVIAHTRRNYILNDGEMAVVTKDSVWVMDRDGKPVTKRVFEVNWDAEAAEKGGYEHFMLKEIFEQPKALRDTMAGRLAKDDSHVDIQEINMTKEELANIKRIYITACGTAYHAGMVGKYIIERLARIPVEVDVASEFRYRSPLVDDQTLVITVSQSGETLDTLAALKEARKLGAPTIAVTNVVGSSIAREADNVFYTWAGPEIAVASTKAYTTQLIAMAMIGIKLASLRGTLSAEDTKELVHGLRMLPNQAQEILDEIIEPIKGFAEDFAKTDDVFFIGRSLDFAVALEGQLKLKEISYIHAEAYPAGELKHGTLALIVDDIPVIALATQLDVYDKMLSNIKEVKARDAKVIGIGFKGDEQLEKYVDHALFIPKTHKILAPVLAVIPLQLLSYYAAVVRGCDVDKPRNLAKSVTVE